MTGEAGGVGGGGGTRPLGEQLSGAKETATENLRHAKVIAKKLGDTVEEAGTLKDLAYQWEALQRAKYGPKKGKAKAKEPPKTEAAKSPPAAKAPQKKTVTFAEGKKFVPARELSSARVSTKPPETEGCLVRLWRAFSNALRALASYFPSFRNPHST